MYQGQIRYGLFSAVNPLYILSFIFFTLLPSFELLEELTLADLMSEDDPKIFLVAPKFHLDCQRPDLEMWLN